MDCITPVALMARLREKEITVFMKRPMLILLILLLAGAVTLALMARQEPDVLPAMAGTTTEPTAEPTAEPMAEPTELPTAEPTEIPTAEPTAVPTEAPTSEPTAIPTPEAIGGEMSLTVPGYQSDVTVTITVDETGLITAMTVEAGEESPGLGRKCAEEGFTAQFIGRRAPFALAGEEVEGAQTVDAVSYATVTSRAVLEAVNTLLATE